MNLYSSLARTAPNRVFFSMLVGALSGVLYALLIPLMMASLQGEPHEPERAPAVLLGIEVSHAPMALAFLSAIVAILLARTWSEVTLARVGARMASQFRTAFYHRIANAPLVAIEQVGLARLSNTINADLPSLVTGAQVAPTILMNCITLSGMLVFVVYLNVEVFWFVVKCIVFGVLSHEAILLLTQRYFVRAAHVNETLQAAVHGLIDGFKELKLDGAKRAAYFDQILLQRETALLRAQQGGMAAQSAASNYGEMLSFMVIGAIIFLFSARHAVSNENLLAITMTLLYMGAPIGALVRIAPELKRSTIALGRIRAVIAELPPELPALLPDPRPAPAAKPVAPWQRVRFEAVSYRHPGAGEAPGFKVGPLDVEFARGEITFIAGGNGSGKSTMSKLLTLHYHPAAGHIHFGDVHIDATNLDAYRRQVGAVYSDYHLFDRIFSDQPREQEVARYLRLLQLERKVAYVDGRFSTLALSDGQRRRMALLAALVEDKELYLFDEWAADQDPVFKNAFYREILPSLRARGKAVVAITHDERYFDLADKLIMMADGQVTEVVHKRAPDHALA